MPQVAICDPELAKLRDDLDLWLCNPAFAARMGAVVMKFPQLSIRQHLAMVHQEGVADPFPWEEVKHG